MLQYGRKLSSKTGITNILNRLLRTAAFFTRDQLDMQVSRMYDTLENKYIIDDILLDFGRQNLIEYLGNGRYQVMKEEKKKVKQPSKYPTKYIS